ncbi:uncharacterized protein LOC114941265 isoform X1 [Nylanderia fulva]|uniref:uncharacterized protein LOC114941265 isoform X1 n=1 Tax=Nylanderia fulva TaxID=613905 RepID=UPI0010FAFE52|nr:uncharacterized protein LOC114941265 isoform X1 [Nylanderia fulva]
MNVTEKQKEIILNFMTKHSDFGRGRIRYNNENKRKMDELWEKLTKILNTAGCGPCKSAKEWAKTWRDWKSNTLKKIAKQKTHMMGTGGGSPAKNLQLTLIEQSLLDFLTPDATGLSGISEGGFEDVMPNQLILCSQPISPRIPNQDLALHNFSNEIFHSSEIEDNNVSEQDNQAIYAASSAKRLVSTKYLKGTKKPKVMNTVFDLSSDNENDDNALEQDNQAIYTASAKGLVSTKYLKGTKKPKVMTNVFDSSSNENDDNALEQDTQAIYTAPSAKGLASTKYSEGIKKPKLMTTAMNLLERKSSISENLKQKMLELKQEKLQLNKEKLAVDKGILQELQNLNNNILSIREVDSI